ncbi:MAG: ATP-grasp domain-containing protein [Xanthomonadales bacterium]|nr:ATP-grasp domain-containing protein [Xanthomonadales bacterium]
MNEKQSFKPRRLGIMGGGQLGMFLCQEASKLGFHSTILEANPAGSAVPYADQVITAGLGDLEAVQQLIDASDVITFELEAIPDESLALLDQAVAAGKLRVYPDTRTLSRFKDKGIQKAWLEETGLPTLPYLTVTQGQVPDALGQDPWTLPVVQKAHRGGYDGKGVQLLRTEADLAGLWAVPSYLEPALDPCLEIGVVVARGRDGELQCYPPVSMDFDARYNAVHAVSSPAEVAPELVARCEQIARQAIASLDTPGVFAVELFVDPAGEVTINEISPRVHNSGHLGLEGFEHSQFEQHVRAVMGLPLAPITAAADAAVMVNILYDEGLKAACAPTPGVEHRLGDCPVAIHWYGKSTGQAGRKMGHLTALAADTSRARAAAEQTLQSLFNSNKAPAEPGKETQTS